MKLNRTNPWVVAIVGTILCVLSGVGIYFLLMAPTQNRIEAANSSIQTAGAITPDTLPTELNSAKAAQTAATNKVLATQQSWQREQEALMPPYDLANRFKAWQQISYELEAYLGPDVERWVPKTGVTLLTPVSIQAPPANPNDITNDPLTIPIGGGTMSVGGSFRHILTHIERWNTFNRLVLIDNLQLTGTSPYMEGTYTASVIIFPQHQDKMEAPHPEYGGGNATTATFGGPGG